jgi:hypothetical protein
MPETSSPHKNHNSSERYSSEARVLEISMNRNDAANPYLPWFYAVFEELACILDNLPASFVEIFAECHHVATAQVLG